MADKPEADDRGDEERTGADRPQDPLVERLRPDPSQPPEPVRILKGLLGDSDRPGFRRLYFTSGLDFYAEFRSDDVLTTSPIASDQPPFLGEEATSVTLRADAPIDVTQSHRAAAVDEFDLDVRLAGPGPGDVGITPVTFGQAGCFETNGFGCDETGGIPTFITCATNCVGETCFFTCQTCFTCGGRTCGGATCGGATCGPTCFTCRTACGGATCGRTCQTCRPLLCFRTFGGPCETRICGIKQ